MKETIAPQALDRGTLERELADRIDESERLRDLARAMADAGNTYELLQVLVQSAAEYCDADAATVTRVYDGVAEVVAASERALAFRGLSFPIGDSLTARAIREHATITHEDYHERIEQLDGRETFRAANPHFTVGPIVITPLLMQGEVMGTLCVMRAAGAKPFGVRDERRLEVLADYASIALKKSRLFEAAQAANQAKSTFLATMSHELRTPLTALTGYGELLADEIVGPLNALQKDTVARMRTVTQHLTVMIDEILTYSSIEGGHEKVVERSVSLTSVVQSAATVIEPLARKKSLMFKVDIDDGIAPINTDSDKLCQILVNLAGNAIKFTDTGSVRLHVIDEGNAVRFSVADTGIGISVQDLARLFQPFTQIDPSLTRRHGGTGLGLYISSRLAALLQGRIEVQSAPGQGSVFSLVLPRH
jgi:signal transduction histidine kinase